MRRHCAALAIAGLMSELSLAQQPSLWESIAGGDVEAIGRYLETGGDPNATTISPQGDSWLLLKIALFDREQEIALTLLKAGADFDSIGVDLSSITREGMKDVLEFVLTQDLRRLKRAIEADGGASVVSPPATRGYGDVLEFLLTTSRQQQVRWDPDVLTEALAAAISFHQNDTARMLLRYGAMPTGMVLRVAARDGSPGIVRTLLAYDIDPSSRLPEIDVDPAVGARTALEYAWIRYNSSPNQRGAATLIMNALIAAGARNENALTAQPLVPNEALRLEEIDDPTERLFSAARFGLLSDVESLLRSPGFDAQTREEAAKTALVEQQNDVARLLIGSGIPINDGILHAAARGNSPAIVRLLVSLGADPEVPSEGRTPIEHWWERQQKGYIGIGGLYVLHELIRAGAPACWLRDHESSLDAVAQMFLRYDATHCWSDP